VVCPTPAPQIVFQADVRAIPAPTERRQCLEQALHDQGHPWRLASVVAALQTWRGVQCTIAVTTVAALGELTHCENPRQLMSSLGLTPSESSTGERRRQGGIPKAGHTQARRALSAGAWAYRYPATVRRHLHLCLEQVPKPSQDLRWKAQSACANAPGHGAPAEKMPTRWLAPLPGTSVR
jgi:transposase